MSETKFFTTKQRSDKGFFNLSSVLKDLFSNKILELENSDEQESSISQINLFMPNDLIKKFDEIIEKNNKYDDKEECQKVYYRHFTNSSNTYTLGNEVIKHFNENGISPFIESFKKKSDTCIIKNNQLCDFLNEMKTALFSVDIKEDKKDENSEKNKKNIEDIKQVLCFDSYEETAKAYSKYISVYEELLKKKLYKNILVRIFISVIILQRQTKGYPHAKYLISSVVSEFNKKSKNVEDIKTELFKTLDKIWLSFDKNDNDEKEVLGEFIKNSIIKSEFEFVQKLCELNFGELIADLTDKKLEDSKELSELEKTSLLSYTQALIKCEKIQKAESILTAKQFDENSDAQFLLYQIYNGNFEKFNTENINDKCEERLKNAVKLNHPDAAILIHLKKLSSNFDQNFNEIDKTLSNLKEKEDSLNTEQQKFYYYYLGLCEEKNELINQANEHFKKALKLGNELARIKIIKHKREVADFSRCFNTESKRQICIINSNNYQTKALLKTLPEEYYVFSINANFSDTEISGIYEFASIKKCIDELIKEKSLKEAIICLFSDDEQENLNQAIEILDRLYNETLNRKERNDRIDFINRFDIFIKANYDYASMFIDASISDMGDDIYFKTHIIDKYKNSIQKLLYEKPLFSPMLSNNTNESNTIVISNNINFNISAIREIISIGYMGTSYTVNAAVVCDKSIKTELDNKLYTEMPGIFKNKFSTELEKLLSYDKQTVSNISLDEKHIIKLDEKYIIKPSVFSFDSESVSASFVLNVASHNISEETYKELKDNDPKGRGEDIIYNELINGKYNGLSENEKSNIKNTFKSIFINNDGECYKRLNSANYFIVDVGNDKENIDFAINLRKQFMANSKDMKRRPIIAVYCRDSKTAYLADKITLSNQNQGDYWYNKYDLYFFGMDDTIYSYNALTNNSLEKLALHMHKIYCNLEESESRSDKYHKALNSFYSYQYNIDSSIATAIALRYRLFIAGYYKSENDINDSVIKKDFNPDNLKNNNFAEIEHYRWVNFMLSRGWQAPTFEQLSTYINDDEITNHKYMLLNLHPFIANWDDLDDDGEICKMISSSQKQFTSPKESTQNNIKEALELLSSFKKAEDKKHIEIEH